MLNTKEEKKGVLRKFLVQAIVFGLLFSALPMIGLFAGWTLGAPFGKPIDAFLTLIGAIIGFIIGTAFLWWYVTRAAPSK